MKKNLLNDFLIDSEHTGRFIVTSKRTGKRYFVEAIGDPHVQWGSVDVATGNMSVKKGWKRYRGSIDACDSMIEEDKGFDKIHSLKAGVSPLVYIDELDRKYEDAS
jgi:hypothetical protein